VDLGSELGGDPADPDGLGDAEADEGQQLEIPETRRVSLGLPGGRIELGPASYRPGRGEIWQAPNRALDLRLYFDAEGLEILERSAEGASTVMRMALTGWGRKGALQSSAAG